MDEGKRKPCYCSALAGILVIVLAWWHVSWSPYALTVLGIVVALQAISGWCCCCRKKEGGSCS